MKFLPSNICGFTSGEITFFLIIGFFIEIGLIIMFLKGYRIFKFNQISDYRKHYISKEECRKNIVHKKYQLIVGTFATLPLLFFNFAIWLLLIVFGMGFFKRK